MKKKLQHTTWLIILFFLSKVYSHPLPNTVVNLDIQSKSMVMNIKLPIENFEIAFKSKISENKKELIANYFSKHIKIEDKNHQFWKLEFIDYKIQKNKAEFVGNYTEIQFKLRFLPTKNSDFRNFTLHYDAIIHEIRNNQALVFVNSDWENGIHEEAQQIGIIELDVPSNTIFPLNISLEKGSNWKGFKSMVSLGMKHIYEGTDHLLFLLVLLLSAPLISNKNKWIGSGTTKYALIRILKIATAFTIGHSVTLIVGALGLFQPNIKLVEILIALSIFVTAIHALKPIFPNKEIFVATGFGLIHGLAFATILSELNLDANKLILSLLGFNIGIEIMQLLVIIIVMPWLLLLSPYKIYKWVRIVGAILAGIAALAWATERFTEKSNFISVHLQSTSVYSIWLVVGLAIFTVFYVLIKKIQKKNN